jgi:ATP-binding cassette subfamily F protein uup
MHYLQVKNLHKSYADKPLFEGIDFTIQQGQKVALVAKNGAGKSTLLDILLGRTDSPIGEIQFTSGVKVDYLAQLIQFDPAKTVKETLVTHDNELWNLILRYEIACEDESVSSQEMQELLGEIEAKDARSFETKVKTIISKLQLQKLLNQPMHTLSWGEQKRVGLAMTLLSEPDFLILDEPTNHLDLEMIEWLEKELKSSSMTLLLVSHDRYFIERVCTHILELEHGQIYTYTWGYDSYLEQKEARLEQLTKQTHIMKQKLRNELERVRKAPRARGSKSVDRTARYYTLEGEYQKNKSITADAEKKLTLDVETRRLGNKIMMISSLHKSFGSKCIVDNFSYAFKAGERVGIIGKNGVGKSTFVELLMWVTPPDSGQIKIGETVVIGYYQQTDILYESDKTVLEVVREHAEFVTLGKLKISATKLLERFMFTTAQQYTKAYMLSGWEKRRLHLLTILIKNPNFLILDEPTNDLDLPTLHVLEEFLLHYTGCLLIISHDRFFMDRLVDHLLVFSGEGEITDFWWTYTQRKKSQKAQKTIVEDKKKTETQAVSQEPEMTFAPKKWLTYMEKREFEDLEKEIAERQAEQERINLLFQQSDLSHESIKELSKELGTVCKHLARAEERRSELAEKWA